MKWLNCEEKKVLLVVFVAAIVVGSGIANADFTWARKAEMPTAGYGSTSVVGSKIYAFHFDDNKKMVCEYDPITDTWTRKADMPTARDGSTCVVNDKIYLIGGSIGATPSWQPASKVEVYDPATDTWAEQTELPTPRYGPVTSVVDGIIYAIGGKGGTNASEWGQFPANMVEAYNPATDTWTRKADMPTPRYNHSGCAINGKIYVIGGNSSGGVTASVEEYDPMTDTWTVKTPMPTARSKFDTCVIDGKICAIGGWRPNFTTISTVEVYDPAMDTWTTGVDLPIPTDNLSASVIDEKIYVFGGFEMSVYGSWEKTSAVYVSEAIIDFNGDEIVDVDDLVIMIENWGTSGSLCDIGPTPLGDGIVDVADLEVLMSYWGQDILQPEVPKVAYWKLDETGGNIAHDSAGEYDGTLNGNPIWQPDGGIVDGALQFDGINDYVNTPSFVLTTAYSEFSIFAWVKGGAPGQVIISQIGRTRDWLYADSADGCLMTELRHHVNNDLPLLSEAVITDGEWHRVGLVWDGSYRTLYVDDMEVASDEQESVGAMYGSLNIGVGKSRASGSYWSGLIDDVRIYNRAITP